MPTDPILRDTPLLPENPVENGILAGIRFAVELIDNYLNSINDKEALTNELSEILIQAYRDGTLFTPEASDAD